MSPPLYIASVPVFRHYLDRSRDLVRQAASEPELLTARLAEDMFTAGEQFATAAGFTLRVAFPLAGEAVPDFPEMPMDADGVAERIAFADDQLSGLDPSAFDGAGARRIRHRAGFAELDQSGDEFLHLFGMPNFLFHLSMGFAILRHRGIEIGKADFDGQHDYPPGFRF